MPASLEARELAQKTRSSFMVSCSSFFGRIKPADLDMFASDSYFCDPTAAARPVHSLDSTRAVGLGRSICSVLPVLTGAQIRESIISPICVGMVNFGDVFPRLYFPNKPMQSVEDTVDTNADFTIARRTCQFPSAFPIRSVAPGVCGEMGSWPNLPSKRSVRPIVRKAFQKKILARRPDRLRHRYLHNFRFLAYSAPAAQTQPLIRGIA
jgi:hypothetical protein